MAGSVKYSVSELGVGIQSCPCPCLCMPSSSVRGNVVSRKVHLSNSLLDSWQGWKWRFRNAATSRKRRQQGLIVIVDELGGQYEDTFNDIKMELVNYFTFKAVSTVLEQLYEMNPPQYIWFNNFVAENVPNKGTRFLQTLVKERRELAERVMITRLTLYGRWIKKCDLGEIYKEISDENLKLMRERLLETIQWPSDETDTTKPHH